MENKNVEVYEIQKTFDTEFEVVSEEMEEKNGTEIIQTKNNSSR
jgi:hypothetical protein